MKQTEEKFAELKDEYMNHIKIYLQKNKSEFELNCAYQILNLGYFGPPKKKGNIRNCFESNENISIEIQNYFMCLFLCLN